MIDLEDVVRQSLRSHAEQAPHATGLAAAARQRSGRHHGKRTIAVVGAACATVAAIVVPLLLSGGSPSGRSVAGPVVLPSATETPPAGEQIIAFHGLEITVPSSWHINDTKCGTPVADTVVRDQGGVLSCLIPRPRGVNSVELYDNPSGWTSDMHDVAMVTNSHGVRLERGVTVRGPATVVVPTVSVVLLINTASPKQTQQIVDSIRLVDVDANGCAMRQTALDPPANYHPTGEAQLSAAVIPAGANALAICHYTDNWLVSSTTVTGDQLTKLVGVVNHLAPGFAHADPGTFLPDICNERSAQGGEKGSGFLLTAHYASRPDVPLWLHIGDCGNLGITNGIRTGKLNLDLAETVTGLLGHNGFSFPGNLLPSASRTS